MVEVISHTFFWKGVPFGESGRVKLLRSPLKYSSISFFAFESRGVEGGVGGVEEDTKRMETRAPSSSVIYSMPKGEEKTVWAFISFP